MKIEWAVLAGALLIAVAIALSNRYALTPATTHPMAWRLDQWTGDVSRCWGDPPSCVPAKNAP